MQQGNVSTKALVKRVAADQLLMYVYHYLLLTSPPEPLHRAPIGLALFLGSMGIMEGRNGRHIQDKYRDLFTPLVVTNWQVWPVAQVCGVSSFSGAMMLTACHLAYQFPLYASAVQGAVPVNLRRVLDTLLVSC